MILRMNLGSDSYDIKIEQGILKRLNEEIKEVYTKKRVFVITDTNVGPLYLDYVKESLYDYDVQSVTVLAGEESKSFDTYKMVLEHLLDMDIKRNELLIALGGGVIGDLTGFIASTIFRGNPFVQIPTSLLAQMDSSIGGKTGIDFYNRKNIIGAFKQPKKVIIDPNTLNTLPKEEFSNGMGELIKHGCIGNAKLFNMLKSHPKIDEEIIYESLLVKKKVVEIDPFDQKERMYLNFGHTFGHVIELKEHLRHGEAVAIGMLMAIRFGIDLGITNEDCYNDLKEILKSYNLPTKHDDYQKLLKETIHDKKNLAGTISFVFIKEIGTVCKKEFKESELIDYGCKN